MNNMGFIRLWVFWVFEGVNSIPKNGLKGFFPFDVSQMKRNSWIVTNENWGVIG